MTPKQRILKMLRGEQVDRLAWSPNLPYWWEAQPDEVVNRGEIDVLFQMGADPLIRGRYPYTDRTWNDLHLFKINYNNIEIEEIHLSDSKKKVLHKTPKGILEIEYTYAESADTWFCSEHPLHMEDDYRLLKYFFENIELIPDYKGFIEVSKKYGEEVLFAASLVPFGKSPFQQLIEQWAGTEKLVYALMDYPETISETLEAMRAVCRSAAEIAADSPAEVFITWEDTSTTNISPDYYKKYIKPDLDEYSEILQAKGKIYLQHACGHLKDLMPFIAESKIDFIESLSPPPTGNIEIWDARDILPDRIGLIGGVEATVLLNSNNEELEKYVIQLIENMKGSKFVLANSDSCPPGVTMEKMELIGELVRKYGICSGKQSNR